MARTKAHRRKGHPSGTPGGSPNRNINRARKLAAIGHDISVLGGGPKRINTAQYEPRGSYIFESPVCNARVDDPNDPDLKPGWYRKTRTRKTRGGPAGSTYMVPFDPRPKCGQPAITSRLDETGTRQHRCTEHRNWTE